MNMTKLTLLVSALALLGGCVAVPAAPGYYTDSAGYYGPGPAYVAPAPLYMDPSQLYMDPSPLYVNPPTVFFGSRVIVRPHAGGGDHRGARDAGRRPDREFDRDGVHGRDRGGDRGPGRR